MSEADNDELLDDLFMDEQQSNIELDDILISTAHTRPRKGIDAKHLSKIWRIDLEAAQKRLDITSQASIKKDNPSLSRNYAHVDIQEDQRVILHGHLLCDKEVPEVNP